MNNRHSQKEFKENKDFHVGRNALIEKKKKNKDPVMGAFISFNAINIIRFFIVDKVLCCCGEEVAFSAFRPMRAPFTPSQTAVERLIV